MHREYLYHQSLARLSRREWLRLASILGGGAVLEAASPVAHTLSRQRLSGYPFTLGVASGDPLPDSVVLWTRLAPDPLQGGGMPSANVPVDWEVARDVGFREIDRRGSTLARPELGHSVHVEVGGLQPGREYWYRFRAGGELSQAGRTLTAPADGVEVSRYRFGVCGCNHYESGFFTAFRRIAEEQFDFVLHTGDYIYEQNWTAGPVRRHHSGEPFTLVEYRNRYAQYKMDPDLIAAHASAPFIVTWDDHEVADNYAGDHDRAGTPAAMFLLRRAAAYQAFYEAMPLRAPALPVGSHLRLYRRLKFGNLMDLSMLDTRQWRSDQACGDGNRTGCAEALDPSRTMLGAEQERWLFENLATARARWTVIGQQVHMFARDLSAIDPAAQLSMDKWDGYAVSRNRLFARLVATRAPNPVVLSGDVHLHYGAELKVDFRRPESRTVGVEFVNTAVSSNGDGADVAPTWERIRPDNPCVKYHSARRGYIACTATPAAMRADFKILDRVTTPGAPAHVGGALVVEAGKSSLQRA